MNKSNGIGFCGTLFLIFLILKLCKVINWSWWLITMPLWIGFTIYILCIILILMLAYIGKKRSNKRILEKFNKNKK